MNEQTTELATTNGKKDVKGLINSDQFRHAVSASLPSHLKPDRFIRVALTALTRTPKLMQCEQESFFQCLLSLSQLGLEPDGRNAHLIPFENRMRGVTECQLIVDYKGLVDLAMRSGKIANIHADKVCQNDVFEYDRGDIKKHQINFKVPRGDAYAYYAMVRFKEGQEKCEVMTKDEIQSIRQRSRAKDSGPWTTDFDEMAKKTVFRRLSKWLQLSPEFRDALEKDADTLEEHRFDTALPAQAMPIEKAIIDKPKGRAKKEKPPKEESSFFNGGENVSSPHPNLAIIIEKRLADSGHTVTQLLEVAVDNSWIDAPPKGDLSEITLESVGEEKLAQFLEFWNVVSEQLPK